MIDRDVIETALALFAAHVFADFLLQVRWIIENKRRAVPFLTHVVVVAVTSAILLGAWSSTAITAVGIITGSHAVIDWIKLWQAGKPWIQNHSRGKLILFLVDQFLHVLVIVLTALFISDAWSEGWWATFPLEWQSGFLTMLCVSAGFVLNTRAGGFMIELFMEGLKRSESPHTSKKTDDHQNAESDNSQKATPDKTQNEEPVEIRTADPDKGLVDGGKWIGLLERTLIFVLIMAGELQAIGFLIAAKSILRFQYSKERSHSETVIIGTLASFGWAIVVTWGTIKAIHSLQ